MWVWTGVRQKRAGMEARGKVLGLSEEFVA